MKPSTNRKQPSFKFKKCSQCNCKRKYLNEFNKCKKCGECKRCYNQVRDYLNEFQICNSCCKQMEQMIPNGFNINIKFEECKICFSRRDYLNEFLICNSCCKCIEYLNQNRYK